MLGEEQLFILFGRGLCYLGLGVYSVLLAMFWGPALILRNVARSFREIGVDSWPRAHGFITTSKVNAVHGWILDYAIGHVEYSYRVHGEYYAGSMTWQFPDEQAAWDFVDPHREEPVVVRYRDDKPGISIFLVPDQGPGWMFDGGPVVLAQVWQHLRDELQPLAWIRSLPSFSRDSPERLSAGPRRPQKSHARGPLTVKIEVKARDRGLQARD
jgi:hypothetical protein